MEKFDLLIHVSDVKNKTRVIRSGTTKNIADVAQSIVHSSNFILEMHINYPEFHLKTLENQELLLKSLSIINEWLSDGVYISGRSVIGHYIFKNGVVSTNMMNELRYRDIIYYFLYQEMIYDLRWLIRTRYTLKNTLKRYEKVYLSKRWSRLATYILSFNTLRFLLVTREFLKKDQWQFKTSKMRFARLALRQPVCN